MSLSFRSGVADRPSIYLDVTLGNACTNTSEAMWWHSSTITNPMARKTSTFSSFIERVWSITITTSLFSTSHTSAWTRPIRALGRNAFTRSTHWSRRNELWTTTRTGTRRREAMYNAHTVFPPPVWSEIMPSWGSGSRKELTTGSWTGRSVPVNCQFDSGVFATSRSVPTGPNRSRPKCLGR